MGREAEEEPRGEKQSLALFYRQALDFGELHTEVKESADKMRSIWRRDFLLKPVRTLRLLDSHPLALTIGQRFDSGEKMKAGMEKVRKKGEGQKRARDFSYQLSATVNV